MTTEMWIEMIGYLGSALVLVSFLMSSVVKLRVINAVGGTIFTIYALIIHSYPTAIMNVCLVTINIYYLIRLSKNDRRYELVEGKPSDAFVHYVLQQYKADIAECFPKWDGQITGVNRAFFVYHEATFAGILLGRQKENRELKVLLDYSTPQYRDCSVGKYLYSRLSKHDIQKLTACAMTEKHAKYLRKMGFSEESGVWRKEV